MRYRNAFMVRPGHKVRLEEIDPSQTGKEHSEEAANATMADDLERLRRLQNVMYAQSRHALLIVLQAPDAGGKDGTIGHVFSGLNPQGAAAYAFKVPTAEEAAHDFLWRVHQRTPALGRVAIFNRSHYEDVLVPRVQRTLAKETIQKRLERIVDFEKELSQAGTHVLKFYLHVSKDEQLRRFEARLDDPQKQWKISDADYADRARWDEYRKAYENTIEDTTTRRSPWFVIPANHKWFRNLAVASIVVDYLDELGMTYPPPSVDLGEIRRTYHAAADGV